jgi:hypothetical protein
LCPSDTLSRVTDNSIFWDITQQTFRRNKSPPSSWPKSRPLLHAGFLLVLFFHLEDYGDVPPKCMFTSNGLHCVREIFITTAGRIKNFSSPRRPDRLWGPPSLLSTGYWASLCTWMRRPGHEAAHAPPTSAEVKKMWINTSTPPYVFIAQCLISLPFLYWCEYLKSYPLNIYWIIKHQKTIHGPMLRTLNLPI